MSGLTTLARWVRGGIVLCYHNVVETEAAVVDSLGLHMPLATFERQMRWLARNYNVIPLTEFVGRLSSGQSLHGLAALTFDDGYRGVFEHAWPLLQTLNIPATVFVVADAPGSTETFWWDDPDVLRAYSPARRERWLTTLRGDSAAIRASLGATGAPSLAPLLSRKPATWGTIAAAVRSGLQLGVHSATHRSLPALDHPDLRREILESREVIERHTGVIPELFAYPYGLWNDRVRQALRAAGYRAAFALERDRDSATADLWSLPRVSIPAGIEDAAFQAWTVGLNLRHRRAS